MSLTETEAALILTRSKPNNNSSGALSRTRNNALLVPKLWFKP